MKNVHKIAVVLFLSLLEQFLFASGAKISAPVNAAGAVFQLGGANGLWYVMIAESATKTSIRVYQPGLATFKDYPIKPDWGANTLFVSAAIVGSKLSVFYQHSENLKNRYAMLAMQNNMAEIYKQDYDLGTLALTGKAEKIFDKAKDGFSGYILSVAHSDDYSKSAVLIESKADERKCKVLVYDNKGEIYAKTISHKTEEKDVRVPLFKVSNDGSVLLMAKSSFFTMHPGARNGRVPNYFFTAIDGRGAGVKNMEIADRQMDKVICMTEPVANWLNNGQIAIAYGVYKNKSGNEVEAMEVLQYDADLKEIKRKEIDADPKLTAQAGTFDKGKSGFNWLVLNDLVPLTGAKFLVVAEYYHVKDESGQIIINRFYAIAYRINENLEVANSAFIAKKQFGVQAMQFCFSVNATHVGDDVYLVYNENFESKPVDGLQLNCMHLPAGGGEPQINKLVRTNDNFFTGIDGIINGENGKMFATAIRVKGLSTAGVKGLKYVEITSKETEGK